MGIGIHRLTAAIEHGAVEHRATDHGRQNGQRVIQILDVAGISVERIHEDPASRLQFGDPRAFPGDLE